MSNSAPAELPIKSDPARTINLPPQAKAEVRVPISVQLPDGKDKLVVHPFTTELGQKGTWILKIDHNNDWTVLSRTPNDRLHHPKLPIYLTTRDAATDPAVSLGNNNEGVLEITNSTRVAGEPLQVTILKQAGSISEGDFTILPISSLQNLRINGETIKLPPSLGDGREQAIFTRDGIVRVIKLGSDVLVMPSKGMVDIMQPTTVDNTIGHYQARVSELTSKEQALVKQLNEQAAKFGSSRSLDDLADTIMVQNPHPEGTGLHRIFEEGRQAIIAKTTDWLTARGVTLPESGAPTKEIAQAVQNLQAGMDPDEVSRVLVRTILQEHNPNKASRRAQEPTRIEAATPKQAPFLDSGKLQLRDLILQETTDPEELQAMLVSGFWSREDIESIYAQYQKAAQRPHANLETAWQYFSNQNIQNPVQPEPLSKKPPESKGSFETTQEALVRKIITDGSPAIYGWFTDGKGVTNGDRFNYQEADPRWNMGDELKPDTLCDNLIVKNSKQLADLGIYFDSEADINTTGGGMTLANNGIFESVVLQRLPNGRIRMVYTASDRHNGPYKKTSEDSSIFEKTKDVRQLRSLAKDNINRRGMSTSLVVEMDKADANQLSQSIRINPPDIRGIMEAIIRGGSFRYKQTILKQLPDRVPYEQWGKQLESIGKKNKMFIAEVDEQGALIPKSPSVLEFES